MGAAERERSLQAKWFIATTLLWDCLLLGLQANPQPQADPQSRKIAGDIELLQPSTQLRDAAVVGGR